MVVVVGGSVEPCRALFLQIQRKPELPVALVRLANSVVFLRNSKVLAITVVRVGSAIASAHGVVVSGARLWLADARANADIILATSARRGFAKETAIAADAAGASARMSHACGFALQGCGQDKGGNGRYPSYRRQPLASPGRSPTGERSPASRSRSLGCRPRAGAAAASARPMGW